MIRWLIRRVYKREQGIHIDYFKDIQKTNLKNIQEVQSKGRDWRHLKSIDVHIHSNSKKRQEFHTFGKVSNICLWLLKNIIKHAYFPPTLSPPYSLYKGDICKPQGEYLNIHNSSGSRKLNRGNCCTPKFAIAFFHKKSQLQAFPDFSNWLKNRPNRLFSSVKQKLGFYWFSGL